MGSYQHEERDQAKELGLGGRLIKGLPQFFSCLYVEVIRRPSHNIVRNRISTESVITESQEGDNALPASRKLVFHSSFSALAS